MRGEVLHFDNEHGFGFITGTDGRRYTFEKTDLRREFAVSKGTLVEFQPESDKARDIFLIRGEAANETGDFGRFAVVQEPESTGLWSYFWRALTAKFANFRGRARRKEYWAYYLFFYIVGFGIAMLSLAIDDSLGYLDRGWPYFAFFTIGLYFFATIIPSVAMQVRRQHDIGLSGWFYLLFFVPYVGGLILFVFGCIPSQKHGNKWGPVPYGVKV